MIEGDRAKRKDAFYFVNDNIIDQSYRHRNNFKWVENDDVVLIGDVIRPQNNNRYLNNI